MAKRRRRNKVKRRTKWQKQKRLQILVSALVLLFAVLAAAVLAIFGLVRETPEITRPSFRHKYSDIVEREAQDNNIDPALVYAIIKSESDFDPNAVSAAGACGLMQLMPDTFAWLQEVYPAERELNTTEDIFDPEWNIRYGVKNLALCLQEYPQLKTAVCAYNAGIGRVKTWLENPEYSPDGQTLTKIPYAETAAYANKVLRYYEIYRELYTSSSPESALYSQLQETLL